MKDVLVLRKYIWKGLRCWKPSHAFIIFSVLWLLRNFWLNYSLTNDIQNYYRSITIYTILITKSDSQTSYVQAESPLDFFTLHLTIYSLPSSISALWTSLNHQNTAIMYYSALKRTYGLQSIHTSDSFNYVSPVKCHWWHSYLFS